MPSNLSKLLCGNYDPDSILGTTLSHLAETLEELEKELPKPFGSSEKPHRLYGPFLARGILEVGATILIARIDPFRILTLHKVQTQGKYEPTVKNQSSVSWQGDILTEKIENLWSTKQVPHKMSRALFSDYQDAILWKPAFEVFVDATTSSTHGSWTRELLRMEPDNFVPQMRQLASSAYSTASKGVHHEFVVKHASYYDDSTLRTLCETSVKVCASLGIVANFCTHLPWRLKESEALELFENIQYEQ
jgi:hypothetical protein